VVFSERVCARPDWRDRQGVMDREYIGQQLTVRETISAGAYVLVDTLLVLFLIGVPALVSNLFSPAFPKRWKLGNVLALLLPLVLLGAIVALAVYLR
jgi:ABC-type uncharacterized transport system permease subunit